MFFQNPIIKSYKMSKLEEILKDKLDLNKVSQLDTIGGGCISSSGCYLTDNDKQIFVKTKCSVHAATMFEGEYESLNHMYKTNTVKVPKPIKTLIDYDDEGNSAIVMEYLNGISSINNENAKILGQKLADLHDYNWKCFKHEEKVSKWIGKATPSEKHLQVARDSSEDQAFPKHSLQASNSSSSHAQNSSVQQESDILIEKFIPNSDLKHVHKFGFHVKTSCGLLPQINEWTDDWVSFYARYRLDHPIRLILQDHHDRNLNEQWSHLQLKINKFFDDYDGKEKIVPSLLHGDLWSGNVGQVASDESSNPVIYDPSSFYGHFEYEFGIARMFGGIPKSFETSYFEIMPRKKRFGIRNKLYQLFHHLNHWNHFGSGYRDSSLRLMKSLNSAV